VLFASGVVFLISRLHEFSTHVADRLFDRELIRAEEKLAEVGRALERAESLAEIERLLVDEPARTLRLASAAVFRRQSGDFRRRASVGWGATDADVLTGSEPLFAAGSERGSFPLTSKAAEASDPPLPRGLARPLVCLPVGAGRRRFALAIYGGHEDGTDLAAKERKLLDALASRAAHAYAQVESETLQRRIAALEDLVARSSVPR